MTIDEIKKRYQAMVSNSHWKKLEEIWLAMAEAVCGSVRKARATAVPVRPGHHVEGRFAKILNK